MLGSEHILGDLQLTLCLFESCLLRLDDLHYSGIVVESTSPHADRLCGDRLLSYRLWLKPWVLGVFLELLELCLADMVFVEVLELRQELIGVFHELLTLVPALLLVEQEANCRDD